MSSSNKLGEEWRVGEQLVEHIVDVQRKLLIDDVQLEMFVSFALQCNVVVGASRLSRYSQFTQCEKLAHSLIYLQQETTAYLTAIYLSIFLRIYNKIM